MPAHCINTRSYQLTASTTAVPTQIRFNRTWLLGMATDEKTACSSCNTVHAPGAQELRHRGWAGPRGDAGGTTLNFSNRKLRMNCIACIYHSLLDSWQEIELNTAEKGLLCEFCFVLTRLRSRSFARPTWRRRSASTWWHRALDSCCVSEQCGRRGWGGGGRGVSLHGCACRSHSNPVLNSGVRHASGQLLRE